MSEELHEMLAYLIENDGGISKSRSRTLASYFASIDDFLIVTYQDLDNLTGIHGRRTIKLNQKEIESVLKIVYENLIDTNITIAENFISSMSRRFINTQLKMIETLQLEDLTPNPLLVQLLNLDTPDELIRLYVYSRVSRSVVTSMGFFVEKLLNISSKSVEKAPKGTGWDLVKRDQKGKNHWIQVKSGPNDMDKDQVVFWSSKIEEKIKEGSNAYIGITYGNRDMDTISLRLIKQLIPKWEMKLLVGRELWDFIADDEVFHVKMLNIFGLSSLHVLRGLTFCNEIEKCILRIVKEFKKIYGASKKGVAKYLNDFF